MVEKILDNRFYPQYNEGNGLYNNIQILNNIFPLFDRDNVIIGKERIESDAWSDEVIDAIIEFVKKHEVSPYFIAHDTRGSRFNSSIKVYIAKLKLKYGGGIMSYSQRLHRDKIVKNIEPYILENVQYETIMGSQAYGVSNNSSDLDIYGFTIPPKRIVFPHTVGHIYGFGKKGPETFKQFQKHHINAYEKEIDLNIFSIVTYFTLLMDNNPNMLDSIFTRQQSVTHATKIGQMVKDRRHIFLHKGSWHRYRGYAYSQLQKIRTKKAEGKRKELVEKFGYDVKFAYHVVRLINQVEDILMHGDFDPMAHREMLKSIRRGEWKLEEIEDFFKRKEKLLDDLYINSGLQEYPDEGKIKQLLLDCLEEFYGTIDSSDIQTSNQLEQALLDIKKITDRVIK